METRKIFFAENAYDCLVFGIYKAIGSCYNETRFFILTAKEAVHNMKKISSFLLALALLLTVFPFSATAESVKLTCTKADDWTALFDRREVTGERTWLGADGIFSISLDGNDAFASADGNSETFFIFSDTITGVAKGNGQVDSYRMPNHTAALLKGGEPDKSDLSFYLGKANNGNVEQNLFVDYRCWMLDGFVSGNNLYLFGFQPSDDWKPNDVELFKLPLSNGEPDWDAYQHYNEAVKVPQLWAKTSSYVYCYGIGITPNTVTAGAPDPDGYLYFYGYRDAVRESSRKDLICARIRETDLDDFSKVTYWDGSSWGTDILASAPLISSVSCELSVTPITVGPYAGKYIAIYTKDTEGSDMMYAIGDSLVGPFDTPVCFYKAPEHNTRGTAGNGTRYTYNAKAHPTLSSGSKLLVSYNVNTRCDFPEYNQWTVDYHPRFLWLDLDPLGSTYTVTSSTYTVDNSFVYVTEGTTAASLLPTLTCAGSGATLSLSAEGTVGTGTVLSVKKNGVVMKEYTVILPGDLTGEGTLGADDLSALARVVANIGLPSAAEKKACDVTGNGTVDASDLTALARKIGKIEN